MLLNFLVAPDFAPQKTIGWNMLNTKWQKQSGIRLRILTPASAGEQARLLDEKSIDLVYANPFDAATLIREQNYIPFARPVRVSDEMVICAVHDAEYNRLEDLKPGCKIAAPNNYDVKLIGLRLLEPADLNEDNIEFIHCDTYQGAMRLVINRKVDIAFCMLDAYNSFSKSTKSQLKLLIQSALYDIYHILLLHPNQLELKDNIANSLLKVSLDAANADIMKILGFEQGFELITQEDGEFMIDLMETLKD